MLIQLQPEKISLVLCGLIIDLKVSQTNYFLST